MFNIKLTFTKILYIAIGIFLLLVILQAVNKTFFNFLQTPYLYFKDSKKAIAIQIGNPIRYKSSRLLSDYHVNQAPQSYCYIYD